MSARESTANPVVEQKQVEIYTFFSKLYSHCNYAKLQSKESERIRWFLVTSPDTPAAILDHLVGQDILSLLERIAEHKNTRPSTLARLAIHDNPRIRAAVAENPRMDKKTMWRLANDAHPDVRMRLAEGYFLPFSLLQMLADDDNPYVQSRARKTLSRLQQPYAAALSSGCY